VDCEASRGDRGCQDRACRLVGISRQTVNALETGRYDPSLSRPLLHMHLQQPEAAGLIVGTVELSEDGKR
jgi:ArsR family transcriptional regulator